VFTSDSMLVESDVSATYMHTLVMKLHDFMTLNSSDSNDIIQRLNVSNL